MTIRSTSIAARAAWAAFASAGLAAAIAAIGASVLADVLVLRQTDRNLVAVASELARKLGVPRENRSVDDVVRDEQQEATSKGTQLALYGPDARFLAGDPNVPPVGEQRCVTANHLRICSVSAGPNEVVAGTFRSTFLGMRAIATLVAAMLAGCVAWGLARVFSRRAVGPLVRLQSRIATTSLEPSHSKTPRGSLGADEGVTEVDQLRGAIETLLGRMHDAIDRSSHFAANAAHELRTPLTTLRAELELASEELPSRPLDVALRKVAQLQSLTERLLVLATPNDDGDDGFEIVSLRDVADEAIAELPTEEATRVTIEDDQDVFVRGDATTLRMVVSNGLSNALKFGSRARIELETESDSAILAIEDDGPGVPESERSRMFEPFARGGSAKRIPGHGLGLALVAHVVKRHRGDARLVTARRAPNGARLEVRLPRVVSTE